MRLNAPFTAPVDNPINYQNQQPPEKGPGSHSKKGKWDEASVELDLPFIEEAIRIIESAQHTVQPIKGNTFKANLRQELEQSGWLYNRRATFKSNLPLRNKYLIFDSSYKLDPKNSYRIKVSAKHSIVSDYKVYKWQENTYPGFELMDLFNSKKGLLIVIICIILLSVSVPLVCSLVD